MKEEVYGALDSFVAWELEFPLIAVKKALRTLEVQGKWIRIIQVDKVLIFMSISLFRVQQGVFGEIKKILGMFLTPFLSSFTICITQ